MIRNSRILALGLVAAVAIAACSGGDDDATPTTELVTTTTSPPTTTTTLPPTTTTEASAVTTTTIPDIPRMPLTGDPIDDDSEIPDRPAMAVKMPNNPQALPQSGLNTADIVFEEIINDNITRFAAVFHSQGIDPLGPIRSGRSQDINMLLAFNRPLFVWSGGNPGVTRLVADSDLIDLNHAFTSGYYRRSGRSGAPHNLYSSTDAMWANTPDEYELPTKVFSYIQPGETIAGEPATKIEIKLDGITARWEYDPETELYYRWQNGRVHETELNGQVSTKNLVVMMADYQRGRIDGTPEAQLLGSNPVYVFSGGVLRTGAWLRFLPTDPYGLIVSIDDPVLIPLQPGRTFVEIPRNLDDVLTWEE